MVNVYFVDNSGLEQLVSVEAGTTIMQAATSNGINGILGDCGGYLNCATCHCYVNDIYFERFPSATDAEKSMLECVIEPQENSRLSCQLVVTEDMDGIRIKIPSAQV